MSCPCSRSPRAGGAAGRATEPKASSASTTGTPRGGGARGDCRRPSGAGATPSDSSGTSGSRSSDASRRRPGGGGSTGETSVSTCRCPTPRPSEERERDRKTGGDGRDGDKTPGSICAYADRRRLVPAKEDAGMQETSRRQSDAGETGSRRSCVCTKICDLTPSRDGCMTSTAKNNNGYTNVPPSVNSSSGSSNSTSSKSSGHTLSCRCSKICDLTPSREGCMASTRKMSVNSKQRSSTSYSGLGDCKEPNFKSKMPDYCTNMPPIDISKQNVESKWKSLSSVDGRFNCKQLAKVCMSKVRDDCAGVLSGGSSGSSSSKSESSSKSGSSCSCSKIGFSPNAGDSYLTESQSTKSCICKGESFHGSPSNAVPERSVYSNPCERNYYGNEVSDVPVKERRNTVPRDIYSSSECICNASAMYQDQPSIFSLESTDFRYLEQLRHLADRDRQLKKELAELSTKEMNMRQAVTKSTGNLKEKPKEPDIRILRAVNKDLTNMNETLTDKIQDLHLEQDQLSQKIYGPLSRELERIRKKYADKRCEMLAQQEHTTSTASNELELLKSQLRRTQNNIADMALVNDGIKQEISVLEYKCDQMEKVLIKQKMNEIEAINKLQNLEKTKQKCSCPSIEKTISTRTTTANCSCGEP